MARKKGKETLLKVREVAALLRYSRTAVLDLARSGRIRHHRLSARKILIPSDEVQRILGPELGGR